MSPTGTKPSFAKIRVGVGILGPPSLSSAGAGADLEDESYDFKSG